jgi:hypothetical protein
MRVGKVLFFVGTIATLALAGSGCGQKKTPPTKSTPPTSSGATPTPTPTPTPTQTTPAPTKTQTFQLENGAIVQVTGGGTGNVVLYQGQFGYFLYTSAPNSNSNYSSQEFCYAANNYCGTGNSYGLAGKLASNTPVIVAFGAPYCSGGTTAELGCFGYYQNNNIKGQWCTNANNYCGTGLPAGVSSNGQTYGLAAPVPTTTTTASSVTTTLSETGGLTVQIIGAAEIGYMNGSFGYSMSFYSTGNNSNAGGGEWCYSGNNYCGTGNSFGIAQSIAGNTPIVVVSESCGGYPGACWGYYLNNNGASTFCNYANSYCGTNNANGIGAYGESYMNDFGGIYMSNGVCTGDCSSGGSNPNPVGNSGGYSNGSNGNASNGTNGYVGNYGTSNNNNSTDPMGLQSTGSSNGSSNSVGGSDTKDVDLQRADLQTARLDDRAKSMASQYSMSVDSARQLVQLSDKFQAIKNSSGGLSDEARADLTEAALGIAGIDADQVNAAVASYIKGDPSAVRDLISKGASNLGMSSDQMLRDQILPSLGINLGQ